MANPSDLGFQTLKYFKSQYCTHEGGKKGIWEKGYNYTQGKGPVGHLIMENRGKNDYPTDALLFFLNILQFGLQEPA